MKSIAIILTALAFAIDANAQLQYSNLAFAGLRTVSDVTNHAKIDLDIKAISAAMSGGDIPTATRIYTVGENSFKSVGNRTLRGFSIEGESINKAIPIYQQFVSYYKGDFKYADSFIQKAFAGTDGFSTAASKAEGVVKGTQYLSLWMKVISELYDGIADCKAGNLNQNDANVQAWEEAWAFYVGSLEGSSFGGSAPITSTGSAVGSGFALFELSRRRCKEFGTCPTGTSPQNSEILSLIEAGRTLQTLKQCSEAEALLPEIIRQMTIPLIQSLNRYIYRVDKVKSPNVDLTSKKEWAEGWTFLQTLLPQINSCNPAVATLLIANLDLKLASPMKDGVAAVRRALESTYSCLGVTCDEIGVSNLQPDSSVCELHVPSESIAGYIPLSNPEQHLRIDLDVKEFEELVSAFRFSDAELIYANGKNSAKSSTVTRSIKKFSTEDMVEKPHLLPLQTLYSNYYKRKDYADFFITSALKGTDDFAGATQTARAEAALKGAQYMAIYMKMLSEFNEALIECQKDDRIGSYDYFADSWDEGWAFYTGSSIRKSPLAGGYLGHTLAVKRCADFGTCNSDGSSPVNNRILAEVEKAKVLLKSNLCGKTDIIRLNNTMHNIIIHTRVPLVQGILRYAFKSDPKAGVCSGAECRDDQGEGYGFVASLLPVIDSCDPGVAKLLVDNFKPSNNPLQSGHDAIKTALESVYKCMGISCSDVGAYVAGKLTACKQDNVESTSPDSNNLNGAQIFGIVFSVLLVYFVSLCLCFRYGKKKGSKSSSSYHGNGGAHFDDGGIKEAEDGTQLSRI